MTGLGALFKGRAGVRKGPCRQLHAQDSFGVLQRTQTLHSWRAKTRLLQSEQLFLGFEQARPLSEARAAYRQRDDQMTSGMMLACHIEAVRHARRPPRFAARAKFG